MLELLLTVQLTAVLIAAVAFELGVWAPATPVISSEKSATASNCLI
jgi:hypothetical protein